MDRWSPGAVDEPGPPRSFPLGKTAAYTFVDLGAMYHTANERLSLQLWVKNLFDVDRKSSTFALATGRLLGATWLPPRTFGATVAFKY